MNRNEAEVDAFDLADDDGVAQAAAPAEIPRQQTEGNKMLKRIDEGFADPVKSPEPGKAKRRRGLDLFSKKSKTPEQDGNAKSKQDAKKAPAAGAAAPSEVDLDAPISADGPETFSTKVFGASKKERAVRFLTAGFVVFLVATIAVLFYHLLQAERIAQMSTLVGEGTNHIQQARTASAAAMQGDADAFDVGADSRSKLNSILDDLQARRLDAKVPQKVVPALDGLRDQWAVVDPAIANVLASRELLQAANQARGSVLSASTSMLASAQAIVAVKIKTRRQSREVALAGEMAVDTQRVAKEAALRLSPQSTQYGQAGDILATLASFDNRLTELTGKSQTVRRYSDQIRKQLTNFAPELEKVLSEGPKLRSAQRAEQDIQGAAAKMQKGFGEVRSTLAAARHDGGWWAILGAGLGVITAILAWLLARAMVASSNEKAEVALRQKEVAERLQAEAKRTNDQNQAAILRLMNELQEVADGDLTVQATVSEDITGAIADSVNYTVEELRSLVSRINNTAELVTMASTGAQVTVSSLQAVSEQQFTEMKQTGQSVLTMARQINHVSEQATESVTVAQQSLSASQEGARAVNNAITGMNSIRDQIQETAKRIKRLGESSQEIGEIVELISNLTEQTNVLALNAAIQAASAGEAGRGFTIVAEEVQRLAERSAEATKQISGLIKAIQADTHDAVAAMERSTEGVVEGTRRSDEAGNALEQIGTVSSQLAEMIEGISETTSVQAASAGTVARSIHNILLVTKQTSEETAQTAGSIQQLTTLSHELKNSVSRFKVA